MTVDENGPHEQGLKGRYPLAHPIKLGTTTQSRRADLVLQDVGTSHPRRTLPTGFPFPSLFLSCSAAQGGQVRKAVAQPQTFSREQPLLTPSTLLQTYTYIPVKIRGEGSDPTFCSINLWGAARLLTKDRGASNCQAYKMKGPTSIIFGHCPPSIYRKCGVKH